MANEIFVDTDGLGSNIDLGIYDFELDNDGAPAPLPDITDETGDGIDDVNITAAGSLAVIDDVIFRAVTSTNAGTGIYNTFLAIGDNDGNEAGFNSDDTPPIDATNVDIDHAKTHTVLLAHVPITVINGVQYYEVRIDINDANNVPNALISLDTFRIFTSTDNSIVSTTQLFAQNEIYNIDDGGDITILLSDAQSSGSGNDDYSILIPVAKFGGADPATTYFYLFAEMGFTGGDYVAGSTFEEFNLQNAVVLTGHKFNDRDGDGVLDGGEEGVGGVTVFIDTDLDGVLDAGERSTVTDSNGNYTFYGVAAGTYRIDEVVPAGSTQTTGAFETITITDTQAGDHGTHVVDPIGNFNPVDISGTKFLDDEGDGLIVGDAGLGGVTIFIDIDSSGTFNAGDLSTTTAGNGTWSFTNLSLNAIGKTVYEVLPSGYVQTLGNAGYVINGDATNLNFANFELFDIAGTKYDDLDGDGVIDAGEPGLGGVIVFIDIDGDGELSVGDLATVTDPDGNWSFSNLGTGYAGKTVYEVLPSGYVQTLGAAGYAITGTSGADQDNLDFANFELFDIAGTKFTDENGDGLTTGDVGLGGVTVFIDVDGSGTLNAGDLSTVTAADGTWSFTDLGTGYAGKKVYEVLPSGYVQTLGAAGYAITGTSGADQDNLNFANFDKFNISGTKFTDENGDGLTTGDVGLGGVTIFIDVDGSGTLNAGDLSTVTAADGTWSFTDLGTGYAGKKVYEVLPSGYVQTLGAAGYAITGTSGDDQTNLNFANFDKFNISGTKFTDENGDGLTTGDVGLGGVTIFIDVDGSGTLNAGDLSTTTAADGTWSFTDLGVGFAGKKVYEVLPSGYVQTLGAAGYTITGTSGDDQTNLNFANFDKFNISGTKFTDENGDGLTTGDVGLGGVTIFIDVDGSGTLNAGDLSTTTAADGTWSFTDLGVGFAGKKVYEVLPSGYVQTLGAAGYTITGTSGDDQTNLNFANFDKFNISGTKFTDENGDGLTTGDVGLGGVTIFIDVDGSGTLNAGDLSTTTAADGTWSFTDLGVGFAGKKVYEVLPSGYVQTLGAAGYTITGTSGDDQTNLNFANFDKFNISGTKFTDENGDGLTTGDVGLGGVTIFIDVDGSGTLNAGDLSTTTAADGTWSFTDLGVGFAGKKVYEVLPSGYVQTLGAAGYTITGTSGDDQTNLNFANFDKFNISGTKFTDENGDGLTTGDVGLGGVTIFIDVDGSGTLNAGDLSTTTAADGTWSFTDLGTGFAGKKVYEVLPSGYVQTLGAAGYAITGTSGADQDNLDFANFELFDIAGTKYDDLDGDGVIDAGEPGLAGVTVFIDVDGSGTLTAGDLSTTTNASGDWSFSNLGTGYAGKTVYEVLPSGYVQTLGAAGYAITGTSGADQDNLDFANFELFDIAGTKYDDLDGDGVIDAGEPGLAGVTVFIDVDGSGTLTAGDLSTTTNASGDWSFSNLGTGYAGKTVYEVLPSGYVQTLGAAGYAITGTSGADQDNLDFANFELFDIAGTKYDDLDGDGVIDAGEPGLAGVTVFIDVDGSGTLTAGDLSTTTNASGDWSFSNLGTGYAGKIVYEVLPSGYVQTLGAAGYAITGTSGADQDNLDFANFELFDIAGTKYDDLDGDGVIDAGDVGLGGVTIFIDVDGSGTLTAGDLSTTTAADGTWSFTDLGVGFAGKKVYEVLPSGYVQTLGAAGYTITGTSGDDQTNLNFANFDKFNISGTKFTDENGDGLTTGDVGLGGVTIFIDVDGSGTLTAGDLSTVTAADGTWSFTDLGVGFAGKKVYEVLPSGYVQTLGAAGYTITGTSGDDQTNLNFANFDKFNISGTKFTDENGDGLTTGDVGLGGVTIFIDVDGSGTLTAGDLSTTTAADGTWSFTDLGVGFAGKKVYEVLPSGYVQTLGAAGYAITGTSGADQDNLDFANFELFDIAGTKYDDLDGDGVIDAGEPGLAGVTVFIDVDGSGTLTAGDLSTTTNASGDWSFSNLGTGYAGKAVYEVLPSGYVQTLGAAGYAITGTSGADQDNLDFANFDPNPAIDLEKYVDTDVSIGEEDADDPDGPIASTSTTVNFHITLANTGNVALTGITLSDSVVHTVNGIPGAPIAIDYNDPAYAAWVDLDGDTIQDAGEDWATLDGDGDGTLEGITLDVGDTLNIYYSLTSELGQHENTASVTATAVLGGETTGDADDANYYVLPSEDCVGVGTPGFWNYNGAPFWDNIQGNETKAGKPGFADGELLYAVDSNNDGVINGSDAVGLLVGDFNHNGLNDEGNAIFISLATARTLIDASQKQQQDGKYMLGRDVVATWLNFLANGGSDGNTSCIDAPGTADNGFNPQHYLSDAINWLQTYAGANGNGNASDLGDNHRTESFDVFSLLATAVKTNSSYWQTAITNVADHSASNMHSALDAYNNTGVINNVEFCCDRDNADALFAIAQLSQTP